LKKNGNDKSQPSKRFTKRVDNLSNLTLLVLSVVSRVIIKVECLNQSHKDKVPEKKYEKNKKQRRAYIAWMIMILPLALHHKKKRKQISA